MVGGGGKVTDKDDSGGVGKGSNVQGGGPDGATLWYQ